MLNLSKLIDLPRLAGVLCACAGLLLTTPARADDYSDLLSAVRNDRASEVERLLGRGMDPNSLDEEGNSLLILAAREGSKETVAVLLRHRPRTYLRTPGGDSALMLAALRGHKEVVAQLLDAGVPVNQEGWNALLYAAFEGRAEVTDLLLARGAEVDARAPNGATALMLAARNGHEAVVRRLLKAGARTDLTTDRGYTAETWAQENGNTAIVDILRTRRP